MLFGWVRSARTTVLDKTKGVPVALDIHAHAIPEALIGELQREVPSAAPQLSRDGEGWTFVYPGGRRSGPVPPGMFDLGARLADMDRLGVAAQALSVPPTHFAYRLDPDAAAAALRLHNDALVATARESPDRFVVLGALPMQDPDLALSELARLCVLPEVVGIEIGTNIAGTSLDDPAIGPVWAALERSGLAVVLHPDDVAGADRMRSHFLHNLVGNPMDTTLAAGSLMFGGVLDRHPDLRVCLLHGGGFLPYQIGRFTHGWLVRPEPRQKTAVSPRDALRRFHFDSLTHDAAALKYLVELVGADRVCLGSDYPFDMADPDPVAGVQAALQEADVDAVLWNTPSALMRRRLPPAEPADA